MLSFHVWEVGVETPLSTTAGLHAGIPSATPAATWLNLGDTVAEKPDPKGACPAAPGSERPDQADRRGGRGITVTGRRGGERPLEGAGSPLGFRN